jgi:hypothetical protein
MSRIVFPSAALALMVACGSSPTNITCPTKAQSMTFTASGSCSRMGTMTVSTQPGLCALTLVGGSDAFGFPDVQAQFTGNAMNTGYDISKGNWQVFVNTGSGNASADYTEINCNSNVSSTGQLNFSCSGMVCQGDNGCGSATCSYPDCMERLVPK